MIVTYRKRHLFIWLFIAIIITALCIIAYNSIPYFPQ